MKYASILIGLLLMGVLAACGGGPKADAAEWANSFPAEITPEESDTVLWERTDDRVELNLETQTNYGFITISYEGDDDSTEDLTAYISVLVYANENAADIEQARKLLDWQVQGMELEEERRARDRFDIVRFSNGGQIIYFQAEETVFEIRIVKEDPDVEITEDSVASLIDTILRVVENAD